MWRCDEISRRYQSDVYVVLRRRHKHYEYSSPMTRRGRYSELTWLVSFPVPCATLLPFKEKVLYCAA
ncbi:hypothetical protein CLIM01_14048 [Colletotrichum limetticola]|uniref:Uncharacterized protein n=1 Tax=Colletotrichum limetticola TaxID=1209924 RepID=A0ABQ9PAN8_9PEZI|nr:hypothetical protein CLIM01_14048 [Colletotrichum limetticola]